MPQLPHRADSDVSVLKQLKKQVVIGPLGDPNPHNGGQNPYGLTVAPVTTGKLTAGDLVVCNFNGGSSQQGSGKSLVAIHPQPGSKPIHLNRRSADPRVRRARLELRRHDLGGSDGRQRQSDPRCQRQAAVQHRRKTVQPAVGSSLRGADEQARRRFTKRMPATGNVVRINLGSKFTYDVIARGFPVNHGVAGTALAPSGLAYDASVDTLYFVDGKNNTLVAF